MKAVYISPFNVGDITNYKIKPTRNEFGKFKKK